MTPTEFLLLASMLPIATAAFLLGYEAAETRERKAKKILDANLRLAIQQKRDLTQWVQKNWPDLYAANHHGFHAGYQQGVKHSPDLEDDA